ncbi:MAG: 16S rRNA (cytosine967-C5)-methyltransferase, partial [Halieaceae bacterium]
MVSLGVRASAAKVIASVIADGQSLDAALDPALETVSARDVGLLKALCYGTLRGLHRYQGLLDQLLDRPLKTKDRDIHALLLLGCHQLIDMRVADHAALATTVEGAAQLGKPWAKSLINGVLRQLQRRSGELLSQLEPAAADSHPEWLYRVIHNNWPDDAESILSSNNAHPPMFLRVNRTHHSREAYRSLLATAGITSQPDSYSEDALLLDEPVTVTSLPGFELGWCSVQDA